MRKMRPISQRQDVFLLLKEGLNKSQISKKTGVPRKTIADWVSIGNFGVLPIQIKTVDEAILFIASTHDIKTSYSYILGLYLGDGYINKFPRSYRMRISLDKIHNELNMYAIQRLQTLFPNNTIGVIDHKNHIDLSVYNSSMCVLFPQHGKGPKHARDVRLKDWQLELIDIPSLMKGLIHSDGCFYTETIGNKYKYDRFSFTNKSKDLKELFVNCCNDLDISYDIQERKKHLGTFNIRVSKKKDVMRLKSLIGTKNDILL